jgi:hypothetical protein
LIHERARCVAEIHLVHPTVVPDLGDDGDVFGERTTEFPNGTAECLLERFLMACAESFPKDLRPDVR